jgi:capsular exopolysaccharide synthesis family protein
MLKIKNRAAQQTKPEEGDTAARIPLHQILWERRTTVLATFLGTLALSVGYLFVATPIYTASAHLYIEQNAPKVATDAQGYTQKDDNFLPTQVEIIRSAPILQVALDQVNWSKLRMFKKVEGDPLDWLWRNGGFKVEVGKKDDIISVTMDSAYPQEAAKFVNAVVDGFVSYQSNKKRGTGTDMVRILESQKKEVEAELDARTQAMLKFKTENGALSFKDQDKGNIILERLASLSTTLTATELIRVDLESQYEQAKKVLATQDSITRFVQSQQLRQKDWGDHSYDALSGELTQARVKLAAFGGGTDSNNPHVKALQLYVNELERRLHEKERAMAEANEADISQQLTAATQKEQSIRATLEEQQLKATELNVKNAEYDRLAADVDRVQKQSDLLDARIKEVRLNSQDAGSLSVNVLAPARVETEPSKPKHSFVLAVGGLLGLLLGAGMALLKDYRDKSLRSVDDGATVLGIPVVGMVPHMSAAMSLTARAQVVHRDPMSEAAEAYRTIRTSLHFGATGEIRTMLVTSPTPGDGKSTVASNLAIALSQAGHRTLLIDADMRRPTQHRAFEMEPETGLSTVLAGACCLEDAAVETGIEGLTLLPAGPIPHNPSEMLSNIRFEEFLQVASETFDRVVIDSPPVLPVADAKVIGASVDAVMLVVRIDKSDRKASAVALDGLHSVGANVFGWVANDMSASRQMGYGGYYGKYYGNGQPPTGSESGRKLGPAAINPADLLVPNRVA